MSTNEELIKQMYDSNLASNKAQLQQNYQKADSEYAAAKEQNAKTTDANLTRTAVEGQTAAMNMAQLHAAQGLSSGTRAQARLSLENQTAANMTALRVAQQQSDADIERQRALLAQDYANAIAKAQADNDLQKAQALYEQAKQEESTLLSKQEAAAKLMAEAGDYSLIAQLYGLSSEQLSQLQSASSGTDSVEDGTANGGAAIAGAAVSGAVNGAANAAVRGGVINLKYPQLNDDGYFVIEGHAMTRDELLAAVANNTIVPEYNEAEDKWTFTIVKNGPESSNATRYPKDQISDNGANAII